MALSKVCSKCYKEKPAEEFYKTSSGRGIFGRRADCKACVNAASAIRVAAWRKKNPGRRDDGDQKYRENNREKCRAACATSIRKRPEYYNAKARQWRIANLEKSKEIDSRYKKNNKEKVNARNQIRRARKMNAKGTYTPEEWLETLEMHAYRCAYCYDNISTLTQDHIVPLINGGRHVRENIVPACRSCNSSKGARSLLEFVYVRSQI